MEELQAVISIGQILFQDNKTLQQQIYVTKGFEYNAFDCILVPSHLNSAAFLA